MSGKRSWTRNRVSERWGIPFWDLIRDIFDQGFNRAKAAAIVGMDRNAFTALMRANPDNNPWGSCNVVANYVRDTGEPFRDALLRMQREGYSLNMVNKAIGFCGASQNSGIRYAMKVRGIEMQFDWAPPKKAKRKKADRGPNVTKGWPTWGQVYAMVKNR